MLRRNKGWVMAKVGPGAYLKSQTERKGEGRTPAKAGREEQSMTGASCAEGRTRTFLLCFLGGRVSGSEERGFGAS